MRRLRCRRGAALAVVAGLPLCAGGALSAQEPTRPQVPVDEARSAADILRARLGLQPGPQGEPPKGPPPVPFGPPPPPGFDALAIDAVVVDIGIGPPLPGAGHLAPAVAAASQQPAPQQPQAPSPPPDDPAAAAARALERLLPHARTPETAPMPTASGTSEPRLPPAPPPPPAIAANGEAAPVLRGALAARYRVRHGDGATDQDVVANLRADVGDADRDAVTAHLRVRAFADFDGRQNGAPFLGLDQARDGDWNARLYQAHVDLHRLGDIELVRAGRQDLDETPAAVSFDGVRIDTRRLGGAGAIWGSVYGGLPVHQFEASPHGDGVFGVAAGGSPWTGGRMRLDAMRLDDEFLAQDRRDDLLSARWWQDAGFAQLRGFHSWRDGKPRDLAIGGSGAIGTATWVVDWRELLSTQRTQVAELDPFSAIVLDYAPYRQLTATVTQSFFDRVSLGVGADVRRLRDRNDEAQFNREFERWHADFTWYDFSVRGLSLTLAGSLWESSGEDFRTVTGELAWRPDAERKLALGSSYDLFVFDAFAARERDHVRTFYLRGEHRLGAALRAELGYEYERDDNSEFHLLRVGMTWTF